MGSKDHQHLAMLFPNFLPLVFTGLVPTTQFARERPLVCDLGHRDKPGEDEGGWGETPLDTSR
jgi:hypothetical protein